MGVETVDEKSVSDSINNGRELKKSALKQISGSNVDACGISLFALISKQQNSER